MTNSLRTHLHPLEAEAIYVIRETAAQFERPVLLFSGGKDSIVMAHLAQRAFWPGKIPFPLLHIDTGHNFPETLAFRDWLVERLGVELVVAYVQDAIDRGRVQEEPGHNPSRNKLQSVTLLDALAEHRFEAALGGGRRDEEKARAKERFFSHRDRYGQWDPKNQRPELWMLYNGRKHPGEGFPRLPAEQLDRDGRLAVHPPEGHPGPVPLLRPPPRCAAPRRHVAGRVARDHAAAARTGGEQDWSASAPSAT